MKKIKVETKEGIVTAHTSMPSTDETGSMKRKKKKKNKLKVQDSEISTTTEIKEEEPSPPSKIKTEGENMQSHWKSRFSTLWLNYKPRSTTLIKAGADWVGQLIKEYPDKIPVDPFTKKELKDLAGKILHQDVENYKKMEEKNAKNDDVKFRKTIYNVGTFRDKMAAHVLRSMESPAHSLHHLNTVIMMISPKAKNEYEEAIDSVLQLLESTFLPEGRVARKFESHQFSSLLPLLSTSRELVEKQLALWYFEDQLYFTFRTLISQLKQLSSDSVDKSKMTGVKNLVKLLKNHPGQDTETVMEAVVNKLGDPSRKVASHTMYSLQHLLQHHPAMKKSVVNTVEILLFRPNVSQRTQYYCLCYLKDIIFKRVDYQLAAKMIKLYIGFFKACTKKGEVDTRMMGALLRGINRAFPFSRLQGEALQEQLETLYKLCHIVNFAIATQALQLIYQVVTAKNQVEDRFYQALYGQMQDPNFGSSTGNTAFLNLVFKAMMRDDSLERRQAFVKRLLQVAQYQSPHLICGILFLISESMKEKNDLKVALQTTLQKKSDFDDGDDDFEHFEDADDEDNVSDVKKDSSDDDKDIKREPVDSKQDIGVTTKLMSSVPVPTESSWFHRTNTAQASTVRRSDYDPYMRNPTYCGAQFSSPFELSFLQDHFHPSVCVFTNKILTGENIDYSGDPLEDFTLMRFLDRFVYKNPKKDVGKNNGIAATLGSKKNYCPDGARGMAVNSDKFISLATDEVPEDQKFFHSYFTKIKSEVRKGKKDDDEDEDAESVGDDEFEDYIQKLHGIGSDDSDIDEDIDFASGAGTATSVKGPSKDTEDDLEGSDDEDENDLEDEDPVFEGGSNDSGDEAEFEGDDDFDDEDMDFDEENFALSDNDDDDDFGLEKPGKKGKSKKSSAKRKRGDDDNLESMFASADDFAHILEETADNDAGLPSATSKALSNKDKAHAKQLTWEMDRSDKIKEHGKYGKRGSWKRGQNQRFRGAGRQKNPKNFGGGPKNKFKNNRGKATFKARRGRGK